MRSQNMASRSAKMRSQNMASRSATSRGGHFNGGAASGTWEALAASGLASPGALAIQYSMLLPPSRLVTSAIGTTCSSPSV